MPRSKSASGYSPTALEERSLASVIFTGSDGEKNSLSLFGEPTDKDDGGIACLPGGDYCCADDATFVAVGQSDQRLCRSCAIDGGVASWSIWPWARRAPTPAMATPGTAVPVAPRRSPPTWNSAPARFRRQKRSHCAGPERLSTSTRAGFRAASASASLTSARLSASALVFPSKTAVSAPRAPCNRLSSQQVQCDRSRRPPSRPSPACGEGGEQIESDLMLRAREAFATNISWVTETRPRSQTSFHFLYLPWARKDGRHRDSARSHEDPTDRFPPAGLCVVELETSCAGRAAGATRVSQSFRRPTPRASAPCNRLFSPQVQCDRSRRPPPVPPPPAARRRTDRVGFDAASTRSVCHEHQLGHRDPTSIPNFLSFPLSPMGQKGRAAPGLGSKARASSISRRTAPAGPPAPAGPYCFPVLSEAHPARQRTCNRLFSPRVQCDRSPADPPSLPSPACGEGGEQLESDLMLRAREAFATNISWVTETRPRSQTSFHFLYLPWARKDGRHRDSARQAPMRPSISRRTAPAGPPAPPGLVCSPFGDPPPVPPPPAAREENSSNRI